MTLPAALDAIAQDLEDVRAEVLREADGLSQAQADWRPSPSDWSVGEILHHLTLAEINTGKLTSKLLKDTGGAGRCPTRPDLTAFAALPPWPPGPREAPPVVRPDKGHPIEQLLQDMRAAPAIGATSRSSGWRPSIPGRSRGGTSRWGRWTWANGGCSRPITTGIISSRSAGSRRRPGSPGRDRRSRGRRVGHQPDRRRAPAVARVVDLRAVETATSASISARRST